MREDVDGRMTVGIRHLMRRPEPRQLAVAHGWFNVVNGLWPLVSMRSFEHVTGPKVDRWLVRTVGALMLGNGLTMLSSAGSPDGLRSTRLLGQATAMSLAAIDLVYAPRGRISNFYLIDAAVEIGWVLAWTSTSGNRHRESLDPTLLVPR